MYYTINSFYSELSRILLLLFIPNNKNQNHFCILETAYSYNELLHSYTNEKLCFLLIKVLNNFYILLGVGFFFF